MALLPSNSASYRLLAPAGGFPGPKNILNAWARVKQLAKREKLEFSAAAALLAEQSFCSALDAKHCMLCGSGKEGLFHLLRAASRVSERKIVCMSAYTCPDIAASAVRAGLQVYPVDIDEQTLDMAHGVVEADVSSEVCAIVASNLYGLADDLSPWLEQNPLIIDDACQSALSNEKEHWLGCRPGTLGVLSFGRGKAFNAIGGGAILQPRAATAASDDEIFSIAKSLSAEQSFASSNVRLARDFIQSTAFWCLEKPYLYRIPASLPGTGIGKTKCETTSSLPPLSSGMLLGVLVQLENLESHRRALVANAALWHENLAQSEVGEPFVNRGFQFDGTIVPIRYPILFNSSDCRNHAYKRLCAAGLGASCSYPSTLHSFSALQTALINTKTPIASKIADRILTLPVHQYVRKSDIERGAEIIRRTTQGRM